MENFEKLQQLKELLDAGILSQEEFESRKNQILFPEKIEEEKRHAEEERLRQEEERQKDEAFDNAIKLFEENTVDSYKLGISGLKKLGEWRDANNLVEKYEAELAELEKEEEEKKAEQKREDIYTKALNKFDIHTSKSYKSAISDLESLGDWGDAELLLETFRPKLAEIEEEETNKKKKIKKKTITGAVIATAIIVLFFVVKTIITPNLADFIPTKSAALNSMSYKIPEDSKVEESTSSYTLYSLNKNNKVVGALEVNYKGDSDLDGQAGAVSEHMSLSNSAQKLIPDAEGVYKTINADNSVFEVVVYSNEKKAKGRDELLKAIEESFNTSGYQNPRTSDGIKTSYTGDTSAGVMIQKGISGLSVSETYKTVKGSGTKDADYSIDKTVTLEAGETSTVVIKVGGKDYKLNITCSDRGAFYKDGSFTASFDDIMKDYIERHDTIAFTGGNPVNAQLNIYKKGDDYGGQLYCDATDRTSVVVFSSLADNGNDYLAADKTPENNIVMIQSGGSEKMEDVMCYLGAFAGLLNSLDPEIYENDAYESLKEAFVDDIQTTRTCGGISYKLVTSSGLYMFKVEG